MKTKKQDITISTAFSTNNGRFFDRISQYLDQISEAFAMTKNQNESLKVIIDHRE